MRTLPQIDMATFAREATKSQMAITYIALLNRANNIAEREQHSGRQGIVLTDEGHIITTSPLVAPYAVKITKCGANRLLVLDAAEHAGLPRRGQKAAEHDRVVAVPDHAAG